MALVTDRLNANKSATPEPKQGKLTPTQLDNNKDLEVDMKKEEPSFFGSFFSSSKNQQQKAKKGPQAMEPRRYVFSIFRLCGHVLTFFLQPRQSSVHKPH